MDTLMIGPVECKECNTVWDALALRSILHKLECPSCHKQNSQPLTTEAK